MKLNSKYLLTVFLLFSLCLSSFAQDDKTENPKKENREADPASQAIQVATNLVQLGLKEKNALYLISAAQLLLDNPTTTFAVEEAENNPKFTATKKEGDSDIALDPSILLAEAKKLSGDDKIINTLIEEITAKLPKKEVVVQRGAKFGRVYTSRRVSAGSYYTFHLTYRGGYAASLSIIGDGDTDLDFYVYDSYGNLVGSDDDYSDQAYFYWTPRRDTQYKIKVINRGNVYNVFKVITN